MPCPHYFEKTIIYMESINPASCVMYPVFCILYLFLIFVRFCP